MIKEANNTNQKKGDKKMNIKDIKLLKEEQHINEEEYRAVRKEYKDAGLKCVSFFYFENANGQLEECEMWIPKGETFSREMELTSIKQLEVA